MIKIIGNYQNANPPVDINVSVLDAVEPFEASKSSPLVNALSMAVRKVTGKPAILLRKTGTGDMNLLGHTMNLPIVTYGPGDSHLDHTLDEHIKIDDYLNGIKVYKETILKLASSAAKQ
jgi:LysW-gamma-L-lysine carboxypeptidase